MQTNKTKSNSNLTLFTPNFKRKRISQFKTPHDILPTCTLEDQVQGLFTGFTVEVRNPEHIRRLYDAGCFGKGSKSRSCPEFIKQKLSFDEFNDELSESLLLDLEEAFFLAHFLKVIQIEDINGILLNSDQIFEKFIKVKPNFVENLVAYLYLRAKNWIVRSGTKFGANFLIYKKGLRFFHASFIVFVDLQEEAHQPKDIKGIQRIAETSDKDVLLLEISRPKEMENILQNLDKFTLSENIIKRFNYSAFVQSK
ncbi:tRNA-splicing endonuclease subunit Sen2 [Episyrphus balteatus]|uniref:tRNA-splicing endonuclease subunit Sen2 n=1 Tax=Episyrphus balteatus TaxID=286459 RepID=UPI0024851BD8|nr:tRNA-splicing endonuclease subunit Sen2 [Episyrphus balteatus]